MSGSNINSAPDESYVVRIRRLSGQPPFQDPRPDWWGYRVSGSGRPPFNYWILGADYLKLGNGFVQREAVAERLGDGRDPLSCDDPHPDVYYDRLWDSVIADLHLSGHPDMG